MEYFKIGKLAASHGFEGEMILKHSLGKKCTFEKGAPVFLEDKKNSFIPWFIVRSKAKNEEESFILIEGIDSKEKAAKYLKKEVWLSEDDFHRLASPQTAISLLGFQIVQKEKIIGEIEEVIEQPHQVLCKITIDKKEAWIPLHEAFLKKVDKKKKIIYVELPEGLLDIYKNT